MYSVTQMVTQNQNENRNEQISSNFLNEKEILKFLILLNETDKAYTKYRKYLEQILNFFKELELKYSYLIEEDYDNYKQKYDAILVVVENLKNSIYNIPSPIQIINYSFPKK